MRIAIFCLFTLLLGLDVSAGEVRTGLEIIPATGNAPLKVSVRIPKIILDDIQSCVSGVAREISRPYGLSVSWGDGTHHPSGGTVDGPPTGEEYKPLVIETRVDCSAYVNHVYQTRGSYEIHLQLTQFGDDRSNLSDPPASIPAFRDKVTVLGGELPSSLSFVSPKGGERFFSGNYDALSIVIRPTIGQQADLKVELVRSDGTVIGKGMQKGIARSDEVEAPIDLVEGLTGEDTLFVRASLLAGEKVLATQQSESFFVTNEIDPKGRTIRMKLGYVLDSNPLKVKLVYPMGKDASYRIDWGDGSKVDEAVFPRRSNTHHSEPREFLHTYSQPGTYRVKFWCNELHGIDKQLKDIHAYQAETIQVPNR